MKLTAQTMKNLGWKELWPMGNPTEPWWQNEKYPSLTFYKLPQAEDFISIIQQKSFDAGNEFAKNGIKKALGL